MDGGREVVTLMRGRGLDARLALRAALTALAITVMLACWHAASACAETVTLGLNGWQVQSSATVTQSDAEVSAPSFPAAGWLAVTPDDAGAPGTELTAL